MVQSLTLTLFEAYRCRKPDHGKCLLILTTQLCHLAIKY